MKKRLREKRKRKTRREWRLEDEGKEYRRYEGDLLRKGVKFKKRIKKRMKMEIGMLRKERRNGIRKR